MCQALCYMKFTDEPGYKMEHSLFENFGSMGDKFLRILKVAVKEAYYAVTLGALEVATRALQPSAYHSI